jgi:hypothetical protein
MPPFLDRRRPMRVLALAGILLATVAGARAAPPPIDENEHLQSGFKVLAATTKVQQDWVRGLPAGKIRAMQRTGKKYFIYPDAAKNQIYVGGPQEYETYVQLHPEHRAASASKAARETEAYRGKQNDTMQKATARDLTDPFLGASWNDLLGW